MIRYQAVGALLVTLPLTAAAQRELTPAEQVTHVLSRLTFGARPGDAQKIAAMGVDRWINHQLRPNDIGDGATGDWLAGLPTWRLPIADLTLPLRTREMRANAPRRNAVFSKRDTSMRRAILDTLQMSLQPELTNTAIINGVLRNASADFAAGKIILAEKSERQLLQVVTDFWENHFSVYTGKVPSPEAIPAWDREVIRPYAFGRFRALLGAVARSPAMLYYLDNHLSTRNGLNENYARELLELHAMGADGGYTQDDVINVARALTGWSVNPLENLARFPIPTRFAFRDDQHDRAPKTVLGHTLAGGRGIEDGEEVLDILARHPSTARFIATKLARRLVSDDPPESLIKRAADTFLQTDGSIAHVVHTIVTSPEFFSRAAFRAKAKTPFEYIVSIRRALNAQPDQSTQTATLALLFGQPTFGNETPDGWPDDASAWLNAGAVLKRVLFAADVAHGKIETIPIERWDGWRRYRDASTDVQVEGVVQLLCGGFASRELYEALRTAAVDQASGQERSGPSRLREMVAVALSSPEFMRR